MPTSNYYVYTHTDPDSGEIVYVGQGTLERAWSVSNRAKDHSNWLKMYPCLLDKIVIIRNKYLTKEKAIEHELALIENHRPKFNKNYDYPLVILSEEGFNRAQELRNKNLSYSKIARELHCSTMTIYRALNRKTKAYDKFQ